MSRRWHDRFLRWRALPAAVRGVLRDQAGATIIIYALTLPALIGFAGLAVEVGQWYDARTKLQTAADAGALAGAWELKDGGSTTKAVSVADEAVGKNPVTTNSITVATPPTSGAYAGNAKAVQVTLTQQQVPLFSALFNVSAFNISATATALVQGTNNACLLALDSTGDGAVTVNGNVDMQFGSCVLASNSDSQTDSILFNGHAQFTGQSLVTVGDYETNGNVSINLAQAAETNTAPLADPFANLDITSPAGCDYGGTQQYVHSATLQPGTYCGGITINGNATITLEPGTYYINGGDLTINGNTTVQCDCSASGSGVSFVFTNQGGSGQTGTLTINGNTTLDLQAPTDTSNSTSYPYPGLLFVQDRNASQGQVAVLNGNAHSTLQGAMYFPNGQLVMNGNLTSSANCTEIVAWRAELNGNVGYTTQSSCAATEINPLLVTAVELTQ